jgi:uncharacterized protein YjbI with pentapeptide repeats
MAILQKAKIAGADLSGADLGNAVLVDAHAEGTNFSKARMYQTIATRLAAEGALFRGADLTYADFSHAILDRADLSGVTLSRTNFHAISDQDMRLASRAGSFATDPDRSMGEDWHLRAGA